MLTFNISQLLRYELLHRELLFLIDELRWSIEFVIVIVLVSVPVLFLSLCLWFALPVLLLGFLCLHGPDLLTALRRLGVCIPLPPEQDNG